MIKSSVFLEIFYPLLSLEDIIMNYVKKIFPHKKNYNFSKKAVLKDTNANLTSGYFGGYFEQAGYVEPSASHSVSKAVIIILPIVG